VPLSGLCISGGVAGLELFQLAFRPTLDFKSLDDDELTLSIGF
jgi:hypothetical protein